MPEAAANPILTLLTMLQVCRSISVRLVMIAQNIEPHNGEKKCRYITINPLRTAVPFWGQSNQISSTLSPNRDCGSKGVKGGGGDK